MTRTVRTLLEMGLDELTWDFLLPLLSDEEADRMVGWIGV